MNSAREKKQSALTAGTAGALAGRPCHSRYPGSGRQPDRPTIDDMDLRDLTDPRRLQALFHDAVTLKIVRNTPIDRLRFFAMACNARRVGRNPCALFAHNLYHRNFDLIGVRDERTAEQIIGRLDRNEQQSPDVVA